MLAAKTKLYRARLSQEVRVILPPCGQEIAFDPTRKCQVFTGAIQPLIRKVQILVPLNPIVVFGLDMMPVDLGPDRGNYKLPPLAAGTTIKVELFPDQWLIAAADVGIALLGMMVEYHHMEVAP